MFPPTSLRQIGRMRPALLIAAALSLGLAACATAPQPMSRATGAERQAAIDSLKGDVPPQSTEMARGQCWMRYENSKVAHDLDEKMKLVDQCMEEKKRQYPMVVQ
jgi:hypothetical protein